MKNYTHLTKKERIEISKLLAQGLSICKIARRLGRHKTSISREVKRNSHWKHGYIHDHAQNRYKGRRHRHRATLFSEEWLQKLVIDKLAKFWTPQEISGYLRIYYPNHAVCAETIYRFIYSRYGRRINLYKLLKYKHKKRIPFGARKKRKGSKIPNRTSIHERSEKANKLKEFGHWEADLIINKGGNVAVLHERKSRFMMAIKNPTKHSKIVIDGINLKLDQLPDCLKKSMTFDQGTEFTNHQEIQEKQGMQTYFCDPYSPEQKGGVENSNGRLRRFIPKNQNINDLSQHKLDQIIDQMNNVPRKCLGYKTPKQYIKTYST